MKTLFLTALIACALTGASNNVYTTESGKKYHTHKDCQYIRNSTTIKSITIADAQKQGKTLCSRCKAKDNKKEDKK